MTTKETEITYAQDDRRLMTEQAYRTLSRSQYQKKMVDLVFKNIVCSLTSAQPLLSHREILKDVTGICPGGKMTAILGSSGAGKTTLLNALAGRISNTNKVAITGQVFANSKPYDANNFTSFASYVMQNDVLFESFTPKEAFEFVANLKYKDPQIRKYQVEEVIRMMKLDYCQHNIIGGLTFKGISGGERKRTSIGFELVHGPKCLLLDEPTSGLDSFTSFQIINELRNLAHNEDKTIILTIHQPSSDIFMLFDRIMLLTNGQLIYQGPRIDIITYFRDIGFQCPIHSNPLDYFISIMDPQSQNNIDHFNQFYESYQNIILPTIEAQIQESSVAELPVRTLETTNMHQILIVAQRAWRAIYKNKMFLQQRMGLCIFFGLLCGGCFWNVGNNNGSYANMSDVSGCLFFFSICLIFSSLTPVLLGFNIEREIFLREENSRLYSTFTYFIAKSMIDVPFCLISPIVQELILYWMCGLNDSEASLVITHIIIAVFICICGNSIGLCIGCAIRDIKVAVNAGDMMLVPMMTFSGFIANSRSFYTWIGWIKYISPIKYSFEAFAITEFQTRTQYINQNIDPIELLDLHFGVWSSIAVLIGLAVFFRIAAFLFLYNLRVKLQ